MLFHVAIGLGCVGLSVWMTGAAQALILLAGLNFYLAIIAARERQWVMPRG